MNYASKPHNPKKRENKARANNVVMNTQTQLLDASAKRLAKTLLLTEGELLTVLMEMSRLKVFAELNYTGVFDYCLRVLNFSREQSYYFKKVVNSWFEPLAVIKNLVLPEKCLS